MNVKELKKITMPNGIPEMQITDRHTYSMQKRLRDITKEKLCLNFLLG